MLDIATCLPHRTPPASGLDDCAWDDEPVPRVHDGEPPAVPRAETRPLPAKAPPASLSPEPSLEADARRCIRLIQRRDEKGLRQLHDAWRHRAFACALAIVRRDEMAHEIVSTSFMQVWTTSDRYDPERGSALGWLTLIVRSRAFDALRSAKLIWQREVSSDGDDALHGHAAEVALGPLAVLERQHRERRVQRALLRLSPMQRQVLTLTTLDGLSHDEASRHLEMPLGTLKSHARRGLLAMRVRCVAIGLSCE